MTPKTIHLVDDDPAVRAAIAFLLGTEGYIVQAYDSGRAFLAAAAGGMAGDCLVTDLRMPVMDGIELLRAMQQTGIAMPVIVITGHGDVPLAVAAMKAGATDFIEKPFDDEILFDAVEGAIARAVKGEDRPDGREVARRLAELMPREKAVLSGILDGMTNVAVASALDTSPRTVEICRANLMSRMRAKTLPELLRMTLPLRDLLPPLPARPGAKRI